LHYVVHGHTDTSDYTMSLAEVIEQKNPVIRHAAGEWSGSDLYVHWMQGPYELGTFTQINKIKTTRAPVTRP